MSAFTREPTRELTTSAQAFLPLVEAVRVHRVNNRALALGAVPLTRVGVDEDAAVVVDAHNGLVDVDARLTLPAIAKRVAALGYWLPLFRPLPALPLWRVATRFPFVVDAVVQSATLISVDGDVFATPRGPRHSAGPSMLHATTTNPPFSFLVRARLRVTAARHAGVEVIDHGSVDAAAAYIRDQNTQARVFAIEACGARTIAMGGAVSTTGATTSTKTPQTPWATTAPRARQARSLAPGDVPAMIAALTNGERVCAVPFMQRVAALAVDRVVDKDVKDVRAAAQDLANALRAAPSTAAQSLVRGAP